jgi:hypothetical protein
MQLRYLQTLSEVGAENNTTVIFPMPLDIVKPFLDIIEKHAAAMPVTVPAPLVTLAANGAKN